MANDTMRLTYAQIDEAVFKCFGADCFHFGPTTYREFARTIEQASRAQALEEAIRKTAQAKTTSHACDAIRALAKG